MRTGVTINAKRDAAIMPPDSVRAKSSAARPLLDAMHRPLPDPVVYASTLAFEHRERLLESYRRGGLYYARSEHVAVLRKLGLAEYGGHALGAFGMAVLRALRESGA